MTINGKAISKVDSQVREADPAEDSQTEGDAESPVHRLADQFLRHVDELARALKQQAVEKAEKEAQQILADARAEAEMIMQAATKAEATARDLSDRIAEEFTSAIASVKDLLSKPSDPAKGSDEAKAPTGNPPWN